MVLHIEEHWDTSCSRLLRIRRQSRNRTISSSQERDIALGHTTGVFTPVSSNSLVELTKLQLEPRKKLQLDRELGLQPRLVAIWFQNKRARWKSKQLDYLDYIALRAEYDNLLASFESLEQEKQSLAKQDHISM